MAMSKKQIDAACEILHRFKTKDLPPYDFSWDYIAEKIGVARQTLYRNEEIKELYAQARSNVRQYKAEAKELGIFKKGSKADEYQKLKEEKAELKAKLARVRERLSYAQLVAQKSGVDPMSFMMEFKNGND